jgi:hypothetical protein
MPETVPFLPEGYLMRDSRLYYRTEDQSGPIDVLVACIHDLELCAHFVREAGKH